MGKFWILMIKYIFLIFYIYSQETIIFFHRIYQCKKINPSLSSILILNLAVSFVFPGNLMQFCLSLKTIKLKCLNTIKWQKCYFKSWFDFLIITVSFSAKQFTLLMKLDFPTLGNPQIMIVLVLGSMEGKRLKCCLTCSK